jgi:superfamily I DNA/RNA helicase
MWMHNFHSFGYRLLRDTRRAGLTADATLLDQVGQRLLLRELRPPSATSCHRLATNATRMHGRLRGHIDRARMSW